ncbi:FtsQ-type POTRA domain-containing protein [Spiribacter sp. 2438]|nr:FtsQ-type POTRA domain-containing protein [Spiribacter sp. 2438]
MLRWRQLGRWLMGLVALATLAWGGMWALDHGSETAVLPLETVRFDGDLERLSEAELREAVSAHLQGGLLGVDVAALRRGVEALPWVDTATVRRVWPDTVRITIREQQPVARWGEVALMNAKARVFQPRTLPDGLPSLTGPPGSAARVLEQYQALRLALTPLGLEPIGLDLDERRAWTVELADGGLIRLGREDTQSRIERLIRAWPRITPAQDQRIAVIDLRYPNGFSLRWTQDED